jgi:hypothetical protein
LKRAVALALGSVGGTRSARDWAEPLIDMIGFLLGADDSVPTENIDSVAEAIGRVIAAIAHADRSAEGKP